MAAVQIGDVQFEDSTYNAYSQYMTEEKSRLIQSGALVRDTQLDNSLMGGSGKVSMPKWGDLENNEENISNTMEADEYTGLQLPTENATPDKIGTILEEGVRLSRNKGWAAMQLSGELAGSDPMRAIANRTSTYRARRLQACFVATMTGIFADNDAAPTVAAGDTHDAGDMTIDKSGLGQGPGSFNAKNFLEAILTMGDSMEDLSLIMVHSQVYHTMQALNLIDFREHSNGLVLIPTYLGKEVIIDDGMPNDGAGKYESWIFGLGAVAMGVWTPDHAVEADRIAHAGNGGGEDILWNRWTHCLHPKGNRFVPPYAEGGPSNANTAGNLAHADSWSRVVPDRKSVRIARLITQEI